MSDNFYQTPQSDVNQTVTDVELGPINSCSMGSGLNWINEAWRLFLLRPGTWIGLFVLNFVVLIVVSLIPLVNVIALIFVPVITGGWMIAATKCDKRMEIKLDDLFAGFSKNTRELIFIGVIYNVIALLIGIVLATVLAVGFDMKDLMTTNPMYLKLTPSMIIFELSFLALILPVAMMAWYAPVLVVNHKIGAWEAMKKSFNGCMRNVLPLTLYSIVYLILMILASIPLMLGFLVVVPLMMISVYASYKDIFLTRKTTTNY